MCFLEVIFVWLYIIFGILGGNEK